MTDDPSFDPPRGLIVARVLAVIGCAAAGTFAFLWMDSDERRIADTARFEGERKQVIDTAVARARKDVRANAAREIAAERARHALALEGSRGAEAEALAARLTALQTERDGLMKSLTTSRERSQILREDVKRMQREMEAALASGQDKMRDATRRWADELAKATRELGDAEAAVKAKTDAVKDLEAKIADPREGPLGKAVLAHVEDIYGAIDVTQSLLSAPDPGELVSALGRGGWLQPFLADRYVDPVRGEYALAHTAVLDRIDHVALVADLAKTRRNGRAFTEAAARALIAGAQSTAARDERIVSALRHPETAVRLVAVEAAFVASIETVHPALVEALSNDSTDVVARAISNAALTATSCRHGFIAAIGATNLSDERRRQAWQRLLDGPVTDVPPLTEVAARHPSVLDQAPRSVAPSRERLAALLGEAMAQPDTATGCVALRHELWKRLSGEAESPDWAVACDSALIRPYVLAAATRAGTDDAERRSAAAMLPRDDVFMSDPDAIAGLVPIARPAHLPYLVANAPAARPRVRIRGAVALHRLGHPLGRELLDDLVNALEPDVRIAALRAATELRLPNVEALIQRRLHEASPMREAAISAAATLQVAIPHDSASVVLTCFPPWTEMLLDALGRSGEEHVLGRKLLLELADGNIIDGDSVARWIFDEQRRPDASACRAAWRHPHPAVRVRAIEASRGLDAADELAARVTALDPFVTDSDFRVRIQVARSLAMVRHDLARTTLVRLAKDSSAWVRDEAVQGLGRQERYHVIPVLRSAAHDENPYVRNAAYVSMLAHGVKTESSRVLDALDDPRLGLRTRRALDRLLGASHPDRAAYARAIERL